MKRLIVIFVASLLALSASLSAQRRINPVRNAATVTQPRNEVAADTTQRSNIVHMHDADGNVILVDTVTGLEVPPDSLSASAIPKMLYPRLYQIDLSVDIWSAVMRAMGNGYGLTGVQARLNMHNRYFPAVEIGVGMADYTPDSNNYKYKSPLAPYVKIGADYNIFYNSDPQYSFFGGLRYGFTPFKFKLYDVTINNDYWHTTETFNFPSAASSVGYLEFRLGLKVAIYKNISAGWAFSYHTILHQSVPPEGKAWYIPGYGTNGSTLGGALSIFYTLPIQGRKTKQVDESDIKSDN